MNKRNLVNYNKYFYYFISPFVIIFSVFSLYPLLNTLVLSFCNVKGFQKDYDFIGIQNYIKIFKDIHFYRSLLNVIRIWTLNFIPQLIVGLILAVWFTDLQLKIKGVEIYKAIIFMPYLLTTVSIAMLFTSLVGYPSGTINQILVKWGFLDEAFNFLRSRTASWITVSVVQIWMFTGYTIVMFMSGIAGIPVSLYESVIIDGANMCQAFFKVTLPLLRPIVLYLMIITVVNGLQIFELPYIIGGAEGKPDGALRTTVVYIYSVAFKGTSNYSYAASLSMGLFLLIAVFSVLTFRLLREKN
jgi:multiple sugar transport system permease protein